MGLGGVAGFVLDRGHFVDGVVDAGRVVPVDPGGGLGFDFGAAAPGTGPG